MSDGLGTKVDGRKKSDSPLNDALNTALRTGRPADFSDFRELAIYTVHYFSMCSQITITITISITIIIIIIIISVLFVKIGRLQTRCRYLYKTLLSKSPACTHARRFLLPTIAELNYDHRSPAKTVKVCSIGGGPGFDHVAVSIAAAFLASIQPLSLLQKSPTSTKFPPFENAPPHLVLPTTVFRTKSEYVSTFFVAIFFPLH